MQSCESTWLDPDKQEPQQLGIGGPEAQVCPSSCRSKDRVPAKDIGLAPAPLCGA